jgi:hypothetical protein
VTGKQIVACAALLAACGGGAGASPTPSTGPPSAKTVADDPSDFPGLNRCPESGSYDTYLKQEQAKAPAQYTTDSKDWANLKANGANDGYIVVYAENTSDCGHFGSTNPSGKVAYVYAVRFNESTAAASAYRSQFSSFHLSDAEVANLKAAGGTVQQGLATGLGANSIVVSIDSADLSFYTALWQKKQFEVQMPTYNVPPTTAAATATRINGRIH